MHRSRTIARALAVALLSLASGALAAGAGPREAAFPSYFAGVIAPMLTPYQEGDLRQVDEAALGQFTRWLCRTRVSALFPVSGVGQRELLSREEKKSVIAAVIAAAQGRKPVIAGVGGRSPAETLELARFAIARGASAIAVVTPEFLRTPQGRLSQDVLLDYLGGIARALPADVPILIYDSEGELVPETLRALSVHPNIQAVKYRTDSSQSMARMVMANGDRVAVLTGIELNTLATLAVGGVGVIGGGANAFPDELVEIFDRFRAGDLAGALRAQQRIIGFYDVLRRNVELKLLLNRLAKLPIAYSERAGTLSKLVAKDIDRDPQHLDELARFFAGIVKPAAPEPTSDSAPRE